MRQFYKSIAIVFFGLVMALAQDVEAQRRGGDNGNQRDRGNDRQGQGQYDHGYDRDFGRNGRHGQDIRIGYGNQSYRLGRLYTFEGRVYRMKKGMFFVHRRGFWKPTVAPYGMRVDFIPWGAQPVYTHRGVLHEFRGTFYRETRFGAVVAAPPKRFGNRW